MRLLVGITRGRDIPEAEAAVDNVLSKFDKIIYSYFRSWVIRPMLRDTFLRSPEYSHLAILPDDMIVTKEAIDILMDDLSREDYPVLCGCANLDVSEEGKKTLSVSPNVTSPVLQGGTHHYDFIVEGSERHTNLINMPQPIIVKHMGDPFPIIRRDVVYKLTFHNNASYNGVPPSVGCCEDVVMSYELDKLGIPIYCDLRARMHHLKISDSDSISKLLINKKEATINIVKST